jgi:hypothetical protein
MLAFSFSDGGLPLSLRSAFVSCEYRTPDSFTRRERERERETERQRERGGEAETFSLTEQFGELSDQYLL